MSKTQFPAASDSLLLGMPTAAAAKWRVSVRKALTPAAQRVTEMPPPIFRTNGGITLISVRGLLVQSTNALGAALGFSGYSEIGQAFAAAIEDSQIAAVLLDVDSLGGELAGSLELADVIFSSRPLKSIWCVVSGDACGTAFAIASAAQRVLIGPMGGIGGVSVLATDRDSSDTLQAAASAGQDRLARVVARNLGQPRRRIEALGRGVYIGVEAVAKGLADGVLDPTNALPAVAVRAEGWLPDQLSASVRNLPLH